MQGLVAHSLILPRADGATRRLMGNAMSLCVLEPLLRAALIAVDGLDVTSPNRWADGTAQCELLFDAWGSYLDESLIASLPRHVLQVVSDGHCH